MKLPSATQTQAAVRRIVHGQVRATHIRARMCEESYMIYPSMYNSSISVHCDAPWTRHTSRKETCGQVKAGDKSSHVRPCVKSLVSSLHVDNIIENDEHIICSTLAWHMRIFNFLCDVSHANGQLVM